MASIIEYTKDITNTLSEIKLSVEYKKPYYTSDGYGPQDFVDIYETYTLEDLTNEFQVLITTTSIGVFYEMFHNTVALNSITSFALFNAITDFNGTVEIEFNAPNFTFRYLDSSGTIENEETYDVSVVQMVEPEASVKFTFDTDYSGEKHFELEITEFKVEYDLDEDVQEVGDTIYPITDLYGIDSEHTIYYFQNTDLIDFVQKGNEMFIVTGTKFIALRYVTLPTGNIVLVAQEVDNYAFEPNTQEVAIGGLNLIKQDPFLSIDDFEGGITFNPDLVRIQVKYGITNIDNILRCFVTLKGGTSIDIDSYDFKVEAQKANTDDLTVWDIEIQDFTQGDNGRQVILNFAEPSEYNFKVTMRETGTTNVANYKYAYMYGYVVDSLDKNKGINISDTSDQINGCTKIVQYYNKLILYANGTPNIYKTFGGKSTWFTISGIVPLNALRQEVVNKIIPLDNALLGFTNNSMVALVGKGDDIQLDGQPYEPFSKFITLDENIGAIAPDSVVSTNDGKLIFLSNDGLYVVTEINLITENVTKYKIDDKINNIIIRDPEANGILYDNKYYLCFPNQNRIIKWHFVYHDIFTLDESTELVFRKLYNYDNTMYGLSTLNKIMEHRKIENSTLENIDNLELSNQGLFIDDEEIFICELETKNFSFGFEQYVKRLFEFYLGFNSVKDEQVKIFINVYADNVPVISTDEDGVVITTDEDGFDIVTSYDRTTEDLTLQSENAIGKIPVNLGTWNLDNGVLGFFAQTFRYFEIFDTKECMRIKLNIKHKQDNYLQIFQMGFVFDIGFIPKSGIRL